MGSGSARQPPRTVSAKHCSAHASGPPASARRAPAALRVVASRRPEIVGDRPGRSSTLGVLHRVGHHAHAEAVEQGVALAVGAEVRLVDHRHVVDRVVVPAPAGDVAHRAKATASAAVIAGAQIARPVQKRSTRPSSSDPRVTRYSSSPSPWYRSGRRRAGWNGCRARRRHGSTPRRAPRPASRRRRGRQDVGGRGECRRRGGPRNRRRRRAGRALGVESGAVGGARVLHRESGDTPIIAVTSLSAACDRRAQPAKASSAWGSASDHAGTGRPSARTGTC